MRSKAELCVKASFSGCVALRDHEGICRHPHGYRFQVEVRIGGCIDPQHPWLGDLHHLEGVVKETLDTLEGKDLSRIIPYPSLEGIALWIASRLKEHLPSLTRVTVKAPPRYRVELYCSEIP